MKIMLLVQKLMKKKIQVFSSSEIQSIKRELLVINEEPFNGENTNTMSQN